MTQFDAKLSQAKARQVADTSVDFTAGLGARSDIMADSVSASNLAELLELTARILHSRGFAADLFPAQWMALRYFARAPRELCTASELARFQGLANGPVSRTVRILVQKGLLRKADEQPKGRAELLQLTEQGQAMLTRDPSAGLEAVMEQLPEDDRQAVARALEAIIRTLSPTTRPQ